MTLLYVVKESGRSAYWYDRAGNVWSTPTPGEFDVPVKSAADLIDLAHEDGETQWWTKQAKRLMRMNLVMQESMYQLVPA
jgi:hypothetical protein